MSTTTTPTPTGLSITLQAVAERLRGQAQSLREGDHARRVAEYRATAAEILAAAEDVPPGELGAATMDELAELAAYAAQDDSPAHRLINAWRSGSTTLPGPLYDRCPEVRARAVRTAEHYVSHPRFSSAPTDSELDLLPDDLRAQVEQAVTAYAEEQQAERESDRERDREREAAQQRRAGQFDALARHYLADDPEALAGWDAGEIRPQEVEGRVMQALREGLCRIHQERESCSAVDRVSVAAYRRGREVVAHLTEVSTEVGTALGLPVSVERDGYHRQTVRVGDHWEDSTESHWTADYTVYIGDLEWSVTDVILD